MTESHCIVCNTLITPDTDSEEHIIQNAVGGRRTVWGFLDKYCNSRAGETWDAALAKQMQPLCLFFDIVRDRGNVPPMRISTTAGEVLNYLPGGALAMTKPSYEETQTPEGIRLSLSARDWREARRMLKDAKEKYPSLDTDKVLASAVPTNSYPQGLLHIQFQFAGSSGGRSIVKTAAAFACSLGIDTRACDLAGEYLRNDEAEPCFGHYFVTDMVRNRQPGLPFHCVAISGNPDTGMLLGYVEYFGGALRVVVCLSQSYRGSAIHGSYAINPLTGKELDVKIDWPHFDKAGIEAVYRYERTSVESQKAAFESVLAPAMKRRFEKEMHDAVAEAVEYGFANCGAREGDILTGEKLFRLAGLVSQRLAPFLARRIERRQPRHSPAWPIDGTTPPQK
jgi:HNH endonuclease